MRDTGALNASRLRGARFAGTGSGFLDPVKRNFNTTAHKGILSSSVLPAVWQQYRKGSSMGVTVEGFTHFCPYCAHFLNLMLEEQIAWHVTTSCHLQ